MSVRSDKRPAMRELVRETVANAILDAAEVVASERGIEGATIAAIAERAGVAVGTLYNYFPDRDALLTALMASRRKAIIERVQAVADSLPPGTVEQRLEQCLAGVLAVFDDHRRFVRLAFNDDGTFARIKSRQRPADVVVVVVADVLRPLSKGRADEHARMLMGSLRGLAALRLEQDAPFVNDAAFLARTFLHGIGS